MGVYRGYGTTNSQSLEAMFLSIPNVSIVSPSIYHSPGKLLKNALRNNHPTLFVEHKGSYAQELILNVSGIFKIDLLDSIPLFPTVKVSLSQGEPADITLITYGYVSALAVKVAYELFMEEEIIFDVLIASSIKPIPILDLIDSVNVTGKILTVEEGVITGGWGAELSSIIHEKSFSFLKAPVVRVGAKDIPIPSAKNMEIDVLPSEASIKNAITKMLT
jgi:pyruvate/2-oxoglutarate/acetoin dehydrogenase E1 component